VIVEIDSTSSVPAYEQVRAQIAAKISSEELPAGTKLPTIRGLTARPSVAAGHSLRPGAAGRERLRAAARDYAKLAKQLGIPGEEALREVVAHFEDSFGPE
jgi:hypothetical protein